MHASRLRIAFRQPDAEARRGAGVAQPPKHNGLGKLIRVPANPRPRTVGVVEDLAPFLAIEGLERPILMNGDISRRESTTDEISKALVEAKTTLASKSYDFDEARLRSRNAALALEASHAAFAALMAETDRLRASRHHHSK